MSPPACLPGRGGPLLHHLLAPTPPADPPLTPLAPPPPNPPPLAARRLLASHHLSELELGLVANLEIETADEAKKLVPTLDMATEVGAHVFPLAQALTCCWDRLLTVLCIAEAAQRLRVACSAMQQGPGRGRAGGRAGAALGMAVWAGCRPGLTRGWRPPCPAVA